jgi:hypothetical protein
MEFSENPFFGRTLAEPARPCSKSRVQPMFLTQRKNAPAGARCPLAADVIHRAAAVNRPASFRPAERLSCIRRFGVEPEFSQ